MALPTREQIEEYVVAVEEYVSSSFTSVTPDIPAISDAIHRLWLDVSRFGPPQLPDIRRLPGLGSFEVPPSPPPPPPPPAVPDGLLERAAEWAGRHKKVVGACVLGVSFAAGYGATVIWQRKARAKLARKTVGSSSSARKLVVVVLGADTPLGLPLVTGLEKEGYIVIASVSTPEAVSQVEAMGNGFVRALVLDPQEPKTMPYFLRSLQATLSLRFPLHMAGDPYQHSPSVIPQLFSVISLLTLPDPLNSPSPAPFEHLDFQLTYQEYLTRTHIVPLQTIQALLPLFRINPVRLRDASSTFGRKQSIVICVPATDARVGVPYASAQAMSAAATARGAEVLRREIGQATRFSEKPRSMQDLRVVLVDVGAVGDRNDGVSDSQNSDNFGDAVKGWTATEQSIYAMPYVNYLEGLKGRGTARYPSSVDSFVRSLVGTVGRNAGKSNQSSFTSVGLKLWSFDLRRWFRGDRFGVGAGASTYMFASYLPTILLDALLNLPAFLVAIRNKYLPISPRVSSPILPPTVPDPTEKHGEDVHAEVEHTMHFNHEISPSPAASTEEAPSPFAASGVPGSSNVSVSGVEGSWVSVQD